MNHERNSSEHPHGMEPSGLDQIPYGIPYYVHNQTMGPPIPSLMWPIQYPAQYTSQQPVYQHIQRQQHQLEQVLQGFWENQMQEVENTTDFENQSLPLAEIEKIMKFDEDVVSMEADAPILLARACEMFISELTLRAWNHAEENNRSTVQKNDIAAAIAKTDVFDFLEDIAPAEDTSENIETIPITIPLIPTQGYPFYYMPQQEVGQWLPGMFVCQPVHHGLFMQPQQQYIAYQQIVQQPQRNDGQQQEQEVSQEVDQEMVQESSEDS